MNRCRLAWCAGLLLGLGAHASLAIEIGAKAPALKELRLVRAEGQGSEISIEFEGKVTVIDFWATWCGPCIEAIPHWNELAGSFKGKPVQFIAVSDENETLVRRFLKRTPIESSVAVDAPGIRSRDLYGITGIPTTVLVNQERTVVAAVHPSSLKAEHIEEVVRTGKSSLKTPKEEGEPREENSPFKTVSDEPPLLELSVRRSGARPDGMGYDFWEVKRESGLAKGRYATVRAAILNLFDGREELLVNRTDLPKEHYDFTIQLPPASEAQRRELLQAFFRNSFGLEISTRTELREVYVAKLGARGDSLLKPHAGGRKGGGGGSGQIDLGGVKIGTLLEYFEPLLGKPVLDETGLTNKYDFHMRWNMSQAELLPMEMDREVMRAYLREDETSEPDLSEKQRTILAALHGRLGEAQLKRLQPEVIEMIDLFRKEWAKPERERFKPSAEAILEAARNQFGIELARDRREMEVLVIESAEK